MNSPEVEYLRLLAMRRYHILPLEREGQLQDIVMLASHILETPIALITLLDEDVQHIIARQGTEVTEMPRATSFCTHAIEQSGVMVVENALLDERFAQAPVVADDPNIRFYAGVPLTSTDGYNIGTLCVFDVQPRQPSEAQLVCLKALTNQVKNILDLQLNLSLVKEGLREIEVQNRALKEIAYLQSHEVRGPLTSALGLMNVIQAEGYTAKPETLERLDEALHQLDEQVRAVVRVASTPVSSDSPTPSVPSELG
jgi:GAF domain-containing protein